LTTVAANARSAANKISAKHLRQCYGGTFLKIRN
jgi:hypothetical protein